MQLLLHWLSMEKNFPYSTSPTVFHDNQCLLHREQQRLSQIPCMQYHKCSSYILVFITHV